ncbi:MAG: long-chain fatty acid--CoA ligase, partial [Nitrospirae bacterium]
MGGPPFAFPWSTFAEFFRTRVEDPGVRDKVFLIYHDDDRKVCRTYTYPEFGAQVLKLSLFLRERCGLTRGDHLATVLFNHDQTVMVYFAAWVLGLVVVPINVAETTEKKRYILEHSEAKVVCCWHEYVEELESLRNDLPSLQSIVQVTDEGFSVIQGAPSPSTSLSPCASLHDHALIVYTSGTTGPPKGVILTAYNLLIDAEAIAHWHGFGMDDRLMCVLPIHHVNGTVVTLITPFYCQGSTVLNRKFKTATFWSRVHAEGVTCVSVVPTLLEYLLEDNEDVSTYKLDRFGGFICGAGPLLVDTAARFEDRFPFPIRHGYGLSETTCYSCFLPNDLSPRHHRHWL